MLSLCGLLLLAQTPDGGQAAPQEPAAPELHLVGALEGKVELLPSGTPGGDTDTFLSLRPVFSFAVFDDFLMELGPTFRFRLIDATPGQRAADYGGVLRWQDWDQPSNFGQILQDVRIAHESSVFFLRLKPVTKKTLGLGHLITRYSNQDNPDYHPAAGDAVLSVGPVRIEAFVSDLFGARIFAGDVAWDLGSTFSSAPGLSDRFVVSVSLARDAANAGQPAVFDGCQASPCAHLRVPVAPPVTLLMLDGSAVLLRTQALRLMLLAGIGNRDNPGGTSDIGLLVGIAADATLTDLALSLRIEGRKEAGGFRFGFFGPGYELSRFSGVGLAGVPLAHELFPDGYSIFAEARAAIGTAATVEASLEHFLWGRTDFDAAFSLNVLEKWLVASARLTALGLGQVPRFSVTGQLRWRLFPSFYVLGSGGTVFFPQPDGSLVRGVTVAAGAGVDFER